MKLSPSSNIDIFRKESDIHLPISRFPLKFGASFVGFLALIALVASSSSANAISTTLFRVFNDPLPNALGEYLLFFMEFGSFWIVALIALMALILRKWVLGLSIIIAELASLFIANALKLAVVFERPYLVLEDIFLRIPVSLDVFDAPLRVSGFPSGHTAAATILVVLLWAYVTKPIQKLLLVLLITVPLGRMYAGVHFPLDVLGGLTLGLTLGLLTRQLASKLVNRQSKRVDAASK